MSLASLRTRFISASIAVALGFMPVAAFAGTLSDPVTVSLIAPGGYTDGTVIDATPILAIDTVATATGIHPGDGSNIGSWMLPSEFITFGDSSHDISLRVAAGADVGGNLMTGYLGNPGDHARYEFTGLKIIGETIVGMSVLFDGLDSPLLANDFVHLLSPTSLSVDLDSLLFTANAVGQSFAGSDITINLLTRANCTDNCNPNPVPEPASLALVLVGFAALPALRRRSNVSHHQLPRIGSGG